MVPEGSPHARIRYPDNFAADREAGERFIAAYPNVVHSVRANRAFLARAVRFLVAGTGIRQFLDTGTGVPTADNTHEVARREAPDSRIGHVGNERRPTATTRQSHACSAGATWWSPAWSGFRGGGLTRTSKPPATLPSGLAWHKSPSDCGGHP